MPKSKLIKTLTLIVFFTMISLFVFYRAGMLTSYSGNSKPMLQNSSNGGALPTGSKASLKITDSAHRLMLSSSKVIVMTDRFRLDSTPKKLTIRKLPSKQTEMLSSSKSAIVVRSFDTFPGNFDSMYMKMLKKKKQ